MTRYRAPGPPRQAVSRTNQPPLSAASWFKIGALYLSADCTSIRGARPARDAHRRYLPGEVQAESYLQPGTYQARRCSCRTVPIQSQNPTICLSAFPSPSEVHPSRLSALDTPVILVQVPPTDSIRRGAWRGGLEGRLDWGAHRAVLRTRG
ncbi:uncharacterized protein CCOS01_16618 [Colletotrichum costaricense]|uniref:Uncharacterized protein n=2 Tax=Colletotrichum acutatum species complex TaxID=2707335 RepID=A0AAJ0DSE1_9PEZI|nr:uncharacterized protein CCOS01_16618 [Colletotrichum costaricense]XP_060383551.1 uncharacterized protein CTAM01_05852 [Colletotrichum tamarilloi]KAI3537766.1 hypothetical protein CSPX01_09936 [Colletotrichum filicis]KAK1501628.1 hypothetical protein CTAM01_05852 [Colletotrichum tamarilloi]KAK1505928.1 hypothetical protein CCOS01_16618 [Colletotrichum costaricense]